MADITEYESRLDAENLTANDLLSVLNDINAARNNGDISSEEYNNLSSKIKEKRKLVDTGRENNATTEKEQPQADAENNFFNYG